MTDKQLHRLSRRQLFEMMLSQSNRIDELERELKEAREELENRCIVTEEAGSIAEAALRLSGVFEAAQEAANIYLKSVQHKVDQLQQEKKGTEFDFEY